MWIGVEAGEEFDVGIILKCPSPPPQKKKNEEHEKFDKGRLPE